MSERPLILDLFCGAGGAGMGYSRAGFEVVGVDLVAQPHYPFVFRQGDALACLDALLAGHEWGGYVLSDFAAIHASPICKGYSPINAVNKRKHPMLIGPTRERLLFSGLPWVMENVPQAPFLYGITLCGQMFDLPLIRHRVFETSHLMWAPFHPKHSGRILGIYGHNVWDYSKPANTPRRDGGYRTGTTSALEGREAMGTPWIEGGQLSQAIPPAYTAWIGAQLLAVIEHGKAA